MTAPGGGVGGLCFYPKRICKGKVIASLIEIAVTFLNQFLEKGGFLL